MDSPIPADLAAFLDQSLDAFVAVDDERRYIFANTAAEELFGEPRESIIGRRLDDVVLRPSGQTTHDVWREFRQQGRLQARVQLLRADGQVREVETTARADWRPGVHIAFYRDITARALAERRLATQYEVAQALSEAASIEDAAAPVLGALAFTLDAAIGTLWLVNDPAGTTLRWAGAWSRDAERYRALDAFTRSMRAERVSLPGGAIASRQEVWVPDISGLWDSPRARPALEAGLTWACAFPVFGAGGVIGALDFFGATQHGPDAEHREMMAAACKQISQFVERQTAETRLLVMGRVGWHLPMGLCVWQLDDPADETSFRLAAVNPAARALAPRIPWSEGLRIRDLVPALLEQQYPSLLMDVLRTGKAVEVPEAPGLATMTGGPVFDVRMVPLSDRAVGVLFEDVTERLRLERALLDHAETLEAEVGARIQQIRYLELEHARSEKLAIAGRLAARVAHEIVNPLAGIKNAFALLKDGVPESYPHAHYVPRIEREIARIARIVGQMRELYRPVTEPLADVDVVEVIRDMIVLAEPEAGERSVALRLRASEWPLYGRVQPDALRQILQNLLRNALDVSPPGSAIEIIVEATDRDLTVVVADEGPGVSDDAAEQIFEPFYSTKSPADGVSGLGLGLAIAQGLAHEMRGTITLLRGRPTGAAFRVALPREAAPTPP